MRFTPFEHAGAVQDEVKGSGSGARPLRRYTPTRWEEKSMPRAYQAIGAHPGWSFQRHRVHRLPRTLLSRASK